MTQKIKNTQKRDEAGSRIFATFIITLAALILLLICYKFYTRGSAIHSVYVAATAIQWAGLGVFCIFGALRLIKRRSWLTRLCLAGAAVCFGGYIAAHYYIEGVKLLSIIVTGIAALYLVFLVYRSELFTVAVAIALAALATWMRIAGYILAWPAFYLAAAFDVIAFAALIICKKNGGFLRLGKKYLRFFDKNAAYLPLFISCALSAAVLIGGLFGHAIRFYSMFALIAAAFVYAVYYTVKLM
ncbi:MAG: hypothetical protein ACOX7P_01495 [Oscillospiraceae bacterium]|jgi:hypothetical protein